MMTNFYTVLLLILLSLWFASLAIEYTIDLGIHFGQWSWETHRARSHFPFQYFKWEKALNISLGITSLIISGFLGALAIALIQWLQL